MPPGAVSRAGLRVAATLGASAAMVSTGAAQCRPPASSNEARLLAYYSAPVVLALQVMPLGAGSGRVGFSGDVTYIPPPDPTLRRSGRCFMPKEESTHLTSFLPRPRMVAWLPHQIMLEASYLPPIRVAGAKANLFSGAASVTHGLGVWLGGPLEGTVRAHVTHGSIRGSITCAKHALQQRDASAPCYGTTPSYDTFRPNLWGLETILSRSMLNGRLGIYGGAGTSWLKPRFQAHFQEGTGVLDSTRVEVDLQRYSLFTGGEWRVAGRWSATAQLYAFPEDVALFRVGVAANVGGR
jgi:hypothetical protein